MILLLAIIIIIIIIMINTIYIYIYIYIYTHHMVIIIIIITITIIMIIINLGWLGWPPASVVDVYRCGTTLSHVYHEANLNKSITSSSRKQLTYPCLGDRILQENSVPGNARIWGLGKATTKGTANQQPAS